MSPPAAWIAAIPVGKVPTGRGGGTAGTSGEVGALDDQHRMLQVATSASVECHRTWRKHPVFQRMMTRTPVGS